MQKPTEKPHLHSYLIGSEGVPQFLDDRLEGRCVSGRVKDEDKVEDESVSVVSLVLDALGAAHHAMTTDLTAEEGALRRYMCVGRIL